MDSWKGHRNKVKETTFALFSSRFNVTSGEDGLHDQRCDCLNMSDVCLFCLSQQSFNAPPRSKMKLWKGATFAFMLCGAALSTLLVRNMATLGQFKPKTKYPYTSPSSSSRPSSSSESTSKPLPPSSAAESTVLSRQMGDLHRRTRSADEMNSLLSECKINCYCLPSFLAWSEIRCRVKGLLGFR